MIPAVILAAGASTRMGRPKALLPLGPDADTFLARLLRTFSTAGVREFHVVVGADAQLIREAITSQQVSANIVENREPQRGQLSSLVAAIDALDRPGVAAMLVIPVDMPLVSADTVRAVVAAYHRDRHLIVRPAAGARHGHPVIFDRSLFDELRAADPTRGARAVVAAHPADVLDVPVQDEGAFVDIDTKEEYERWTGLQLDSR